MLHRGYAFWDSSDNPHGIEHLWIILSDPSVDSDRVVLVSLTTYEDWQEDSCYIEKGEHPSVTHPTSVDYGRSEIVSADKIRRAVADRTVRPAPAFMGKLLGRITQGALDSRYLKNKCALVLSEQGLID